MAEMTEEQFLRWIVIKAKKAGWEVYRQQRMVIRGVWRSGMSPRGWPDLILVRPPQLVALEVKRGGKDEERPEQVKLIAALQRCTSVEAYFVRPADANDVLDLLARPRPATNIQSVPPEQEGSTS